jgi:HAD superfamily hydrolase (TIGR01509 family)
MKAAKKYAVVIFDCDGVMFDSKQANIHFYNHLLARFNLPAMKEDEINFCHQHTADESIRRIFKGTPHMDEAFAYRLKMDYTPFLKDMTIEPDLKGVLEALKGRYGLAVATNRSNTIQQVLEIFDLKAYFDIVVSSLDVERPKPHPESIFKILRFFGASAPEALYVGDSGVDQKTARSAGTVFVAYKNESLEADFHVSCLMDVVSILRG